MTGSIDREMVTSEACVVCKCEVKGLALATQCSFIELY